MKQNNYNRSTSYNTDYNTYYKKKLKRARITDVVLFTLLCSGWLLLLWWYVIKLADSV